jgi:glycine dehydrogenase
MLDLIGMVDLDALVQATVPGDILSRQPLRLPPPVSETAMLAELRAIAAENRVYRSFLGLGYHPCITPPIIQRNILENPGWYTQYTPYQAEIAQGRLEALLNFQTMVCDLTGLPVSNASLLDEATAAAEAMSLAYHAVGNPARTRLLAASDCHPQTLAVLATRAEPLGIELVVTDPSAMEPDSTCFAVVVQYPATDGAVRDYSPLAAKVHEAGGLLIACADILSLTLLRPPGEWGADVAVGSTQRFGMPMGAGGPHAAFFATKDAYKRLMPGRLVGVSKDAEGAPALRLALQTREQHIRRDRATSNICTAQVLPAVVASMYAVWHGPKGLKAIAERIHTLTRLLEFGLHRIGFHTARTAVFDTLRVECGSSDAETLVSRARARRINLRKLDAHTITISLDETTTIEELDVLIGIFGGTEAQSRLEDLEPDLSPRIPAALMRTSPFLTHPVFNSYRSEHDMLRYIRRLEQRDLSLTTSMIPLGSCTMKLNATSEMMPITWPEFANLHPFAPADQLGGYVTLCSQLENWLNEITGFAGTSLQPNAGSQGEYAGLLVIRRYHQSRGDRHRDVCLIPTSAHGTNPASAVMCGMKVVPVACDTLGNIDLADLREKASLHADNLAALMVTYPSTHGVFETTIREICSIVHAHGGQVYMDGANMNAQVGLTSPGRIGADVCHLNLHKTFCIPHGGGGPGMGPICVARHLVPFLPSHPFAKTGGSDPVGPVSAAPFGSSLILTIPWAYIRMMGAKGLRRATAVAILSANYIAARLGHAFPVLYRGAGGLVAHECILDCRPFKAYGIEVEDIAKRLMDHGFHAPTMSWPVAGTLMVEPTESESKRELDKFCDAMLSIHAEILAVATGALDRTDNPLKRAPHTARAVTSDAWKRPYPREQAAFPTQATREHKYWPPVSRVDNVHGDRNLVCTCSPVADYTT